jgi:hypothetical protein
MKNISFHVDVCAIIFENVYNQLPCDTALIQSSKDTNKSWWHPDWNWRSWGPREVEGIVRNVF